MTQSFEIPVRLRLPRDPGARVPAAWLISGSAPQVWLEELCAWNVPLEEVRLLTVPRSKDDRRAGAVLAVVPPSLASRVSPSPLAEPYRSVDGRLFVPLSADVHPPLSAEELRRQMPLDVQMMHPSIGPLGGSRAELLEPADLLDPPPPTAADWGFAVPGVAADAHLRSVRPAPTGSIEAFFRESGGDVGASDPSELPPLPDESALRRMASQTALGMMGALSWISRRLGGAAEGMGSQGDAAPAGPSGGGWMQRLQGWSAARLEGLRDALEAARNREMGRLMKLLESNPDEGLRYAPPMLGEGYRGMVFPGSRLTRREVGFSLRSLFSSGPADPWNTEWTLQQRLRAKYRELATRELRLGRPRRAAYIFAELLRDLHAAANALRQGRFYREAATIYRDRLNDRASAAECLEEGGLLAEAIDLYEALFRFEKVGDLHRKLDHQEEAERAYREAANRLLGSGDTLAAARLLYTKMELTDEAIELLEQAWPHSKQAASCLEELFALYSRVTLHGQAAQRVKRLSEQESDSNASLPLVSVLAKVAGSYPNVEVRNLAADATRVVAGRRLPMAPKEEARGLVNAVIRVGLEDRLLSRDAHRYLNQLPQAPWPYPLAEPKRRAAPRAQLTPTIVRVLHLEVPAHWKTAFSTGSTFFALGVHEEGIVVARGDWFGRTQHIRWRDPMAVEQPYRLQYLAHTGLIVVPIAGSTRRLSPREMPAHGHAPAVGFVGSAGFLPPGPLLDLHIDEQDTIWVLHATDTDPNLVLSAYTGSGTLRSSQRTPLHVPAASNQDSLRLTARGGHICIAAGAQLWVQAHGRDWTRLELRRPVAAMSPSASHTRARVAIAFDEGGCLFWPDTQRMNSFGQELVDPAICMLHDGTLVAAGRNKGMLYRIEGDALICAGSFLTAGSAPAEVLPLDEPGEFAELRPDGALRVYRIG